MVACLSLSLLLGCQEQKQEKPVIRSVYAIKVDKTKDFPKRAFPGKAKAVEQANLAFGVDGTLAKLPINVGDQVKKGDIIAQLNQRDFISQVNSAKAELNKNEKNLARAKQLVAKDYISKSDYDKIVSKTDVARAELEVAEKALEDSTIRAPFNGEITSKYVENYESVRAKQVIARILNISGIEMVVQIPENLISRLHHVKTVDVVFDAYPNVHYTATIKEISREASRTTRTYPVNLIMSQKPDAKIFPGMAGLARVKELKEIAKEEKMIIPIGALFTPNNKKQSFVWVVKDGKVIKQRVEVDQLTTRGAVIKAGLTPGDMVVIAGVHSLKAGQQVKVMTKLPSLL